MKTIIISTAIVLASSLLYSQIVPNKSTIIYDAGTDITVQAGADICAGEIIINGTWSGDGTKCDEPLLVDEAAITVPRVLSLAQNYPNPFNPTTTIAFTLAENGHVSLKVFDILGREAATLVNAQLEAGVVHYVTLDASRLATGMYFYLLETGNKFQVKKLMLVK